MTSANERMGSWVMAVTVLVTVLVTRHSEGADHDIVTTSGHSHLEPDPDIEGSSESESSEVNTEQPGVVTSIVPSILIVYEGEEAEGEYAREVLRYELNSEEEELVREITENIELMETLELRDRNSSAELDPVTPGLSTETLVIVILVPILSLVVLTVSGIMFWIFCRRRNSDKVISERKLREKLDKFKQRKLESQREMSISTVDSGSKEAGEAGDFQERYIM